MLQEEALNLSEEHFSDLAQDAKQELIKQAVAAILPLLAKVAVNIMLWIFVPKSQRQAIRTAILLLQKSA